MRKILFLLLAVLIGDAILADEPVANADPEFCIGTVSDRDGNPIEGARIVPFVWRSKTPVTADVVLTDANGKFQIAADKFVAKDPKYVAVMKDGYAFSAIYFGANTARARLWPMRPVAVRIVDENGAPVSGADVSVNVVYIEEAFMESLIPRELAEATSVQSREDGWAILRCTRPTDLRSVQVKKEGYGTQTFATKFIETRFNVLQLCQTQKATLKVTRDGIAAENWRVSGVAGDGWVDAELDQNRDPDNNRLLPIGIVFSADTNKDGTVSIEHAIVGREMFVMARDQKERYRGTQKFAASQDAQNASIDFKSLSDEVGDEYTVTVQDGESGERIPQATLSFWKQKDRIGDQPTSTSNKEGIVRVKLSPGTWTVNCPKPPKGYSAVISQQHKSTLDKDSGHSLPAFKLWKGQTLRGEIVEADLTIPTTRWLQVRWTMQVDGKETDGINYGRYEETGSFEAVIPRNATPTGYTIVRHGGHTGELEIKSKDPLELKLVD